MRIPSCLFGLCCVAALAGCFGDARLAQRPVPIARPEARADAAPAADAARWLRRHAVDVLLVPLLDDDEPTRWAVRTDADPCLEGGAATVDGEAIDGGTPLPTAFTVERRFDGCRAFADGRLALVGSVVLTVTVDAERGLTAVVDARRLRVRALDGREAAVGDVCPASERATDAPTP